MPTSEFATVGVCTSSAVAQSISVANPGSGVPARSPASFLVDEPDGSSGGPSGCVGGFVPTVVSLDHTAPHGNQIGSTNSGIFEQTLTATIPPDGEHVLMVDVVYGPGFVGTCKVGLTAGDTVVGSTKTGSRLRRATRSSRCWRSSHRSGTPTRAKRSRSA